tara:strand:+ start:61 stop:528 length:468 start_codon:yes stop_codon:yes gene_type:complete
MEIEGFNNYLIYEDGRVWSKGSKHWKPKFMTFQLHDSGYYKITLKNDIKRKTFRIHRLIAQYYIPNPMNKPFVDHINRIRTDNRIENLRWATYTENANNVSYYGNTGHLFITFCKQKNKYCFTRTKYKFNKTFKSKIDSICYKYIYLLKLKAGLI